jgi:transposase InsO family protein
LAARKNKNPPRGRALNCLLSHGAVLRLISFQFYPGAWHRFYSSDRGYQYTNKQFKSKLDKAGMTQSMSRAGRCIDNGPMEGLWGILKCEMYYLGNFKDYDGLVAAIESYIYFYNYGRRQKRLNKMAPMTYRQLFENTA